MTREILIAPAHKDIDGPLIFLAGPIKGAPDWQAEAIKILEKKTSDIHIVSPRRPMRSLGEFSPEKYAEQAEWEHHYLDQAAKNGVILFWLARELQEIPGRAYGQTTRFELGEAVARHYLTGIKVVVGIEKGFSNERYLRKTIHAKAPDILITDTLEEACAAAVRLVKNI